MPAISDDALDSALRTVRLRRLVFDSSNWTGRLFGYVERQVRYLHDETVEDLGAGVVVPEIVGCVADDPRFNACAFHFDARYFIVVNYGTLILVHALANRLLSRPDALPWIGDPTKEDATRKFTRLSNNALIYMRSHVAEPHHLYPRDPVRAQAATLLVPMAVEFIVAHELRHILGGHVAWKKHRSGRLVSISELPTTDRREDRLGLQGLEVDADDFAMYRVLRKALAQCGRTDPGPLGWRSLCDTPEHALHVSIMCGLIMLGTFVRPSLESERWHHSSHPPAAVRQGLHIVSADRNLSRLAQEPLRTTTTLDRDWTGRLTQLALARLWPQLGHVDRRNEMKAGFGEVGQQYLVRLFGAWAQLQPEVAKYAVGAPPARSNGGPASTASP